MTIQDTGGGVASEINEREVVEYLRAHPDFFRKHPILLGELEIPHEAGGAVSLIERQVSVLREDNRQLRHRIRDLVEIARDNDALMNKLHNLSVALVQAESLDDFIQSLSERLKGDFAADHVAIRFFSTEATQDRAEIIPPDAEGITLFDAILARKKPVCGRFNAQQLQFLFGDTPDIGSVAVVPMVDLDVIGMFAIASNDRERFRAGMSTVFLSHLAEMATIAVKRFL